MTLALLISVAPLPSEYVRLNTWDVPLPELGETESATGPTRIGSLKAAGLSVASTKLCKPSDAVTWIKLKVNANRVFPRLVVIVTVLSWLGWGAGPQQLRLL